MRLCWGGGIAVALAAFVAQAPAYADKRVQSRDHVQLRIDRIQLTEANVPIEVSVRVRGKSLWTRRLQGSAEYTGLGPVTVPARERYRVRVSTVYGSNKEEVAKVSLSDRGEDRTKKQAFSEGPVEEVVVSTQGVDAWAVPELKVAVLSPLDAAAQQQLTSTLVAWNERIVDITDGRVRIDRFDVYGAPVPDQVSTDVTVGACDGDCPSATGRLTKPAAIRVATADVDDLTSAFGHAFLGIPADKACFGSDARATAADKLAFDCRGAVVELLAGDVGVAMGAKSVDGPSPLQIPEVRFTGGAKAPVAKAPVAKAPVAKAPDAKAPDAEPPVAEPPVADAVEKPEGKTIGAVVNRYGIKLSKCFADSETEDVKVQLSVRGSDGRLVWVSVNGKSEGAMVDCVTGVLQNARFPRSKLSRMVVQLTLLK